MIFRKNMIIVLGVLFVISGCTSCKGTSDSSLTAGSQIISEELSYDHSMELKYASEYAVDYYSGGFVLISISDGSRYLINTENKDIPKDIDSNIVILKQPEENIYMAASAVMDMFDAIDALDNIALSSIKQESWCVEGAKKAMAAGKILYAGKYNVPDYELLLTHKCGLAIESTMILHCPDVKEKLESLGIPVLVDRSSYELHPFGRTEWVKLYGILTGKEEAADKAFEEQLSLYERIGNAEQTGKTAVFFYVTDNEIVVVRKPGDYVAKMIEMAGGKYLSLDLDEDDSASSSVNMQMEEFYAKAKDADYLVYNSTVNGDVQSIDDLIEKSSFFSDFKAVQDGNVWCSTQNAYQQSMSSGKMIEEFYNMFTAEDNKDEASEFWFRLQ